MASCHKLGFWNCRVFNSTTARALIPTLQPFLISARIISIGTPTWRLMQRPKAVYSGPQTLRVLRRDDPAVSFWMKASDPGAKLMTFGGDLPRRPGDFGLETDADMTWLVRAKTDDHPQKFKTDTEPENRTCSDSSRPMRCASGDGITR